MEPGRAKQIDSILNAALELEGDALAQFLDRACSGDSELRRQVEVMLSRDADTRNILKFPDNIGSRFLAHAALRDGERISHYQVTAHIATGGMGEVYQAQDQLLSRRVAIKILPPEFSTDGERLRRFEQEAQTVSRLNHPNIVTIHEVGRADTTDGDLRFLVTEFIDGQTLRDYLKRSASDAPGDWTSVVMIAIQIAQALEAAHIAGIIHRDVKPENIMIQKDGRVKVLDFGIAKPSDSQSADNRHDASPGIATRIGARPGTLRYMSPEQARGDVLDARTDLFSFGVVVFEMLSRQHPFGAAEGDELLTRLRSNESIRVIGDVCPHLPAALQNVVDRALKKSRNDRYSSAGEVLNDLEDLRITPEKKGIRQLRTHSANQLLTQFVTRHHADKSTRIPLLSLWTIRRFADLRHGELERDLIRASLKSVLWRSGIIVSAIAAMTMVIAAWMSVTEIWDEQVMHDGHSAAVRRAAFSPDGRLLVSVGEDRRIILWDFANRKRLATFEDGHSDVISSVAFSPDGRWFVSGSYDKTAVVWNAVELKKEVVLGKQRGRVVAVAFSPDGERVVSESEDGTTLWRAGNWEQLAEIPVKGGEAQSLMFYPGTNRLLFNAGSRKAWDVATGQPLTDELNPDWFGNNAALSPDGSTLVMIDPNGEVLFADFKRKETYRRTKEHQDNGRTVAFSPDGRFVATGAENIILWDAMTRRKITAIDYPSIVWSALFSPDGRWLVSTHGDGSIHVWDIVERHAVLGFNEHGDAVRAVAWSSDGKRFASAGDDRSVMVWDAQRGVREAVLLGHDSRITGMAFASDNSFLASTDFEDMVIIWDLAKHVEKFRFRTLNVGKGIAVSPDCKSIAVYGGVYDVASGRLKLEFGKEFGHLDTYSLAYSRDGSRLAGADAYGAPFEYDIAAGTVRRVDLRPRQFVAVAYSPDDKYLVTGDDSGVVQLWTSNPLNPVAVIGRHEARVKSVVFSADGRQVISAGDDKAISLWDVARRKLVSHIGVHTGPVYAIAVSPDGRHLVSGGHDHTVRLYTRHRSLWRWRFD